MKKKISDTTRKLLVKSYVRYLIVGATSFALDFLIYNFLLVVLRSQPQPDWAYSIGNLVGLSPEASLVLVSNIISLLTSLSFNFIASNYWTFQAGGAKKRRKIMRYATIAGFNFLLNNVILSIQVEYFSVNPIIAKVIVTGAQTLWTFLIYKVWVFRVEDQEEELQANEIAYS